MNSILQTSPPRQTCPPGVCDCEWQKLDIPDADRRILLLTRQEEKRLLGRLEAIESLADLERLQRRLAEQLGVRLEISPGQNEVRTMRGINIVVHAQTGLCRKTRQSIRTAIRRGLEARPDIAWALLNANDLLHDA